MPTQSVRIREETRDNLRDLEELTGQSQIELLARAVDSFRRSLVLAETDCAYGALRGDEDAWAEVQAERRAWEATLSDEAD